MLNYIIIKSTLTNLSIHQSIHPSIHLSVDDQMLFLVMVVFFVLALHVATITKRTIGHWRGIRERILRPDLVLKMLAIARKPPPTRAHIGEWRDAFRLGGVDGPSLLRLGDGELRNMGVADEAARREIGAALRRLAG